MTTSLPTSLSNWNHPPASHRPQPLWVWNGEVNESRITEMLEQFAARGCGGVFIHPRPGLITEYLSARWFELWGFALAESKRLGLECHIYDENSYPSGFAGGHVVSANPLASSSMLFGKLVPSATARPAPAARGRLLGTVRRSGPHGAETCQAAEPRATTNEIMMLELDTPRPTLWQAGFTYVDICRPEVTDQFLATTHEAYARHFQTDFGQTIRYAFADEPEIGFGGEGFTLSRFLLHAFRTEHGYDLLDHLVPLCFEHAESFAVRHDYFLTLNRLFVENYARRCHDWCERHGLKFTGHFMEHQWPTPKGSPSSMAVQRWMQAPGIDLLSFQFHPTTLQHNALFLFNVKEVSSVAAQCGRERVLCECCGGGGYEFTPGDMKPLEDFLLAGGINLFNPHLAHQTLSGVRKYDWPHTLSDHSPWWDAYRAQADHVGRTNFALSQGSEHNRVLVLVPTTTGWLHHRPTAFLWPDESPDTFNISLGETYPAFLAELYASQIDFDLGDEFLLAELGRVEAGRLIVGQRTYDAVVIPPGMENLLGSTVTLLEGYLSTGGHLDFVGDAAPTLVNGRPDPRPSALATRSHQHPNTPALLASLRHRHTPHLRAPDGSGLPGDLVWRRVDLRDGFGTLLYFANCWDHPYHADILIAGHRILALDTRRGVEEPHPSRVHPEGQIATLDLPPRGHALWYIPSCEMAVPALLPTAPAAWQILDLAPVGPVAALDSNLLLLDYCDYEGPGISLPDLNTIHADNAHWHAQGFDHNLWRASIQFRRTFLDAPRVSASGFTVRYRFHLDPAFASSPARQSLGLAIERPWLYQVRLNGHLLDQTAAVRWFDEQMRLLPCGPHTLAGDNIVELTAAAFDPLHEIMPLYLRGDFSLAPAERGFSIVSTTPLTPGDWTQQGRPFYPGKVRHDYRFSLAAPAHQIAISCPAFVGSALDVLIDDHVVGHILRPTERLVLDRDCTPGPHTLTLRVGGNLKNMMGPHFHDGLPGGWSWELCPAHQPPGSAYRFYPTGLPGAPLIETR